MSAHRADRWTISVRYPRFSAGGAVTRVANALASRREREVYREFLTAARKESADTAAPWFLEATPHRLLDRATVASGYVDVSEYQGGAHPSSSFRAVNVGLFNGRARAFGLKDLFRPGEDALGVASRALVTILKAYKEPPSYVKDGTWKGLTTAQQNRFVVGKLGVLFLFDQYDLGPGVEGPRTVLVPFAKLPGLDRRGLLAGVFGR